MIQSALDHWADISKRYYAVIIIAALITAAISYVGASEAEIDTDYYGFFYPETRYMEEIRYIQSEFPGTATILILIEADRINARTVLEEDMLTMTRDLVEAVSGIEGVQEVKSVLDLGSSKEEILSSPLEYRGLYIDKELKYSLVTVELDAKEVPEDTVLVETFQKTVDKVDKVGGSDVTITGLLTWGYAWDKSIRYGLRSSLMVGFAAIFFVLLLIFKRITTPFVILIPVSIAVLASFGLMHTIRIPLNFLTAMFGTVTLGLGVDYGIHLIHRYHEEVAKGNDRALNKACMMIGRNTLVTGLTTMAAFSSMAMSPIRMVVEYGIMSFIAISFSALAIFLFMPSLLLLEEHIGVKQMNISNFSNMLGVERIIPKTMEKISDFSIKRTMGAVIIIGITLIPIAMGLGALTSESDQDMWMPEDDPTMVAWRIVDDEFTDYEYSTILVRADDIRTPEIMHAMVEIEESVEEVPGVVEVMGINNVIGIIPNSKPELEDLIASVPAETREKFVNHDYTASLLIIKTDTEIDEALVRQIDDAILYVETPADATFEHASFSTLFAQMESMMEETRGKTTMISIIAVLAILFTFFRSLFRILLAFSPVLFAIIYTIGIMGLMGIPYTPLTVIIATILVGLGTDYAVHFIARLREEREKGSDVREALHITTLNVGEAVVISTCTTMFGFLSLITVDLIPVQQFGIIAAIGLIYAAFFTPVLVSIGSIAQDRILSGLKSIKSLLRHS
ncbi:MAG: efflux RND transporter permease subunit [Candidatus Syntropharchaeales archaeon]